MTLTREEIQAIIAANEMLINLMAENTEKKKMWKRFRANAENWPGGKLESMANA